MKFKLDDIQEIAAELTDSGPETRRDLILLAGLPGVGKTTVAREFVRQTGAVHFDIDEVKRVVVPEDEVMADIDPPEYRFKYYAETIRKLPELFSVNPAETVVIDETFHLKDFRDMWDESAKILDIKVHWVEVVCDDNIIKHRLSIGKDRESHVLKDKAIPMYLLFKKVFEPMKSPCEIVDSSEDIVPQVQRIVKKRSIGINTAD